MLDELTFAEKIQLDELLRQGYHAADRYWEDRARAQDWARCQEITGLMLEINAASAEIRYGGSI